LPPAPLQHILAGTLAPKNAGGLRTPLASGVGTEAVPVLLAIDHFRAYGPPMPSQYHGSCEVLEEE